MPLRANFVNQNFQPKSVAASVLAPSGDITVRTEEEHYERFWAAQLACHDLAHDLQVYRYPRVQARYPNGVDYMFELHALGQAAPISVLARAMEAKLEFLRKLISHPEHTALRTLGAGQRLQQLPRPLHLPFLLWRGVRKGVVRGRHTRHLERNQSHLFLLVIGEQ